MLVSVVNRWSRPITVTYSLVDGGSITDPIDACRVASRGLDPGSYAITVQAVLASTVHVTVASPPPELVYAILVAADGTTSFRSDGNLQDIGPIASC